MDNVLSMIAKYGPNPESCSFASRHDAIAYHNIWADFWRYNIGVNVIPADTKNKKPVVPWFGWQSKTIPESLHRQWKTEGLFSDGIAVILGKVWHRQDLTNCYLVGVDADNKKAIDEICTYDGKSTTLQELAAKTIVEHHRDNPNKAHFYFYAARPIKGKSSDNALLADRLSANEIPAIEIKSLGSHGILYCSGSFHKDGYNYEIIGSSKPAILNELQTAELENHFNNIFNKYMISYLSIGSADNSSSAKTKLPIEELFKPDYKVLEGHNRHEALLRVMESLILRNRNIFSLEEIKQLSKNWNNTHCMPPLVDRELEGQWKCALEFVALKQRQLSWQNNIGSQDHNQSITAEERQQEQNSHSVSELAEEILSKYEFKTLADTEETLYYRDGIYHSGGEQIIKTELEKIAGYSIKINQRNEIIAHIKYRTIVNREEFDRNESVINVKNGLLDITTGEIRPHKHDYLSIIQSPVTYDPRATCPRVIKFLTGVQTRDGISTLVRLFGYCLYRSPRYEKAIMLVGPGRNGKSVLIKLIEALVGKQNVSHASLQELLGDRFASADLNCKLVNVFADLEADKLVNTGRFKALVSGDSIRAQRKHQQAFSFRNYAKLIFSTNKIPESMDNSYAYYRRWVILPFDRIFEGEKEDTDLISKLTTEEELSGLLNLAQKGLTKLIKEGGFKETPVEKIKQQYEHNASIVKQFIEEQCVIDLNKPDICILATTLRDSFQEFCRTRHTKVLEENILGKELAELGILKDRIMKNKKREYYYVGITTKQALRGENETLISTSTI